eukprot:6492047-Amphidinium_carterae.2
MLLIVWCFRSLPKPSLTLQQSNIVIRVLAHEKFTPTSVWDTWLKGRAGEFRTGMLKAAVMRIHTECIQECLNVFGQTWLFTHPVVGMCAEYLVIWEGSPLPESLSAMQQRSERRLGIRVLASEEARVRAMYVQNILLDFQLSGEVDWRGRQSWTVKALDRVTPDEDTLQLKCLNEEGDDEVPFVSLQPLEAAQPKQVKQWRTGRSRIGSSPPSVFTPRCGQVGSRTGPSSAAPVTREVRASAASSAASHHPEACFKGAPKPKALPFPALNRRGAWQAQVGTTLGAAIMCHQSLRVVLRRRVALASMRSCYLESFSRPSGQRVLGDWNQSAEQHLLTTTLRALSWQCPTFVDSTRASLVHQTYHSGGGGIIAGLICKLAEHSHVTIWLYGIMANAGGKILPPNTKVQLGAQGLSTDDWQQIGKQVTLQVVMHLDDDKIDDACDEFLHSMGADMEAQSVSVLIRLRVTSARLADIGEETNRFEAVARFPRRLYYWPRTRSERLRNKLNRDVPVAVNVLDCACGHLVTLIGGFRNRFKHGFAQILGSLRLIVAKRKRQCICEWRKRRIDSKGHLTLAYYKWLRRVGPCPRLALRTSQGLATTMEEIFTAHVTVIVTLAKARSAGGPDRTPCDWVSHLSLSTCRVLDLIFGAVERLGYWPQTLLVRPGKDANEVDSWRLSLPPHPPFPNIEPIRVVVSTN